MKDHQKNPKPASLIMLDFIGFALIIVGLIDMFGSGNLVPLSLQFVNYENLLIMLGFALLLPGILYSIKAAQKKPVHHHRHMRRH